MDSYTQGRAWWHCTASRGQEGIRQGGLSSVKWQQVELKIVLCLVKS